ncbi:MAG: hypothetical protein EPN79_15855 [Burkholderiaceae bacterium]|nr:MAG: hypothetical protein EPN79_15855 [Burkholderiaceae bacterium]
MSFADAFATWSEKATRPRVSSRARAEMYSLLGSLLDNGALLSTSLDKLYEIYSDEGRKPKRAAAVMIYEVRGLVEDGKSFSEAIEAWVSAEEAALIAAGEKSGDLRGAFTDALYLISIRSKIWGAVIGGTVYPLILVAAIAYMLNIVAYRVIPSLGKTSPPETWEGSARAMYLMSYFVQHFGLITLIALVVLLVGIVVSMPLLTGPMRYYLDKIAPWSVYRRINGALFMLALSVLIKAGVKQSDALDLLLHNANPYLAERIEALIYGTTKGLFLGTALLESDYDFPDRRTILLLAVLDKLDDFDSALRRFSEDELVRVQAQVQAAMKAFFGVMLVIMGLVTAIITLGSFAINNAIGNV